MSSQITVTATVNANIKKAWDYYTQPEHITQWNFADPSWQCPSASNDMQVGGKYSARMEAKDGSFGFEFEATYDEVVPGEKFTYTMPNSRKAGATFAETGHNQTEVSVWFDPEDQNSLEMQRNGWQAILNNFKSYTGAN